MADVTGLEVMAALLQGGAGSVAAMVFLWLRLDKRISLIEKHLEMLNGKLGPGGEK